jgi:hypothetical protein
MEEQKKNMHFNESANELAEKLAHAAVKGSRYLSEKAENISEQMIGNLLKKIILFTFFSVLTFISIYFALHLGLQLVLVRIFPLMSPLSAAFVSALVILTLSVILLGIFYFNHSIDIRERSKRISSK